MELKDKIAFYLKKYKNEKTFHSVKNSLNLLKNFEDIDIEGINELVDSMETKGNSKNLFMSHIKSFIKWHNLEFETTHKYHNLEKFVDDRSQKKPYTDEEWQILLEMLDKYKKPLFKFLFLLQWANAARIDEVCRINWKDEKNFEFMVLVAKQKLKSVHRMILITDELREIYSELKEQLQTKSFNVQVHKNEFSRFRAFVLKHYPKFDNLITSHQLRADKITKMFASGMSLAEVMAVTKHKYAETLFKHYVNESRLTMRVSIERGQMTVIEGLDIQKLKNERELTLSQLAHLKVKNQELQQQLLELKDKLFNYENSKL